MRQLIYGLNILVYFMYIQAINNFYRIFYGSIRSKKKYKFLLLIELIASLFYPLIRTNNIPLSTILLYALIFITSFFYHKKIKDNFIYSFFFICLEVCSEIIAAGCLMIIGSLVFNIKDTFMSTMIKTHPLYYIFAMSISVVVTFLLEIYMESLSKKVTPQQLKETTKLCLFPTLFIPLSSNIIIATNKDTFIFGIISDIILVILNIILIIRGFKRLQKLSQENLTRQAINIQVDDIKSIDQSYRMIRKKNHDFKNHCLIILSMLDKKDPSVKEYLLSMKEKYQQEDNGL